MPGSLGCSAQRIRQYNEALIEIRARICPKYRSCANSYKRAQSTGEGVGLECMEKTYGRTMRWVDPTGIEPATLCVYKTLAH